MQSPHCNSHSQSRDLSETITLVRVLYLAEQGVASRAGQTSYFSGIVVVVHRQATALYWLRTTADVTNVALKREDDIVLFNSQLIIVHQALGARAFFNLLFHRRCLIGVVVILKIEILTA
jgi:hypothetical protein